jgi:hypothetical protein
VNVLQSKKLDDLLHHRVDTAILSMRATAEDARLLDSVAVAGETVTDVLRRAIRRLSQEQWEAELRRDAVRLVDDDVNAEDDAW